MSTKAQLESRIAELEAAVSERDKAVKILSGRDGMEICLPGASMDVPSGDSTHLPFQRGLTERLIEIMEPALRKHGAMLSNSSPAKSIRMHDNIHRSHGETVLVPIVWGEVMAEIIDVSADFGRRCYAEGFSDGSNMLIRMARGEITSDELEDGIKKAKRRQKQRAVRMLIKSHSRLR